MEGGDAHQVAPCRGSPDYGPQAAFFARVMAPISANNSSWARKSPMTMLLLIPLV